MSFFFICFRLLLHQFGSTPAGEHFWQGTRAVVVCVDGQSANCASRASHWLHGSAIAECRKYCPNVLVCLLATKADAFSDHRKENIESEMQDFADTGVCATWAQVSAKAMTGKTYPCSSSPNHTVLGSAGPLQPTPVQLRFFFFYFH